MRRLIVCEAVSRSRSPHINPIFAVKGDLEEGFSANWLRLRNALNAEVGVLVLIDKLRL